MNFSHAYSNTDNVNGITFPHACSQVLKQPSKTLIHDFYTKYDLTAVNEFSENLVLQKIVNLVEESSSSVVGPEGPPEGILPLRKLIVVLPGISPELETAC